jgi:hypothetical protein
MIVAEALWCYANAMDFFESFSATKFKSAAASDLLSTETFQAPPENKSACISSQIWLPYDKN